MVVKDLCSPGEEARIPRCAPSGQRVSLSRAVYSPSAIPNPSMVGKPKASMRVGWLSAGGNSPAAPLYSKDFTPTMFGDALSEATRDSRPSGGYSLLGSRGGE
jgi:hypothetical protein